MASNSLIFKEWAQAEGLESRGDIEQFRDTRIAIEAEDYLNTLLTTALTREPLLPALGGLPFALQKHIDEDIASFRAAGIETIFVFNGLDVAAKDRAAVSRESRKATKILEEAWRIYDLGEGDNAVLAFGKACTYRTQHIARWLYAYLHHKGVLLQTAPYMAAAQMVQLEREGFVHAMAGSASILVFGGEKVITTINVEQKRIAWVEARVCHGKMMLQRDQFADVMLLSGCTSLIPAIPEVELDSSVSKISAARSLMSRAGQDGHTACLQSKDDDYLTAFRKARFAVLHPVVMTSDGRIEPKNAEALPNDTHEFVGQRLPDEVYCYLTRGVIGPRVLNWRTRMQIFETPPLDSGSSQAYRELVQEKLRPVRTQSLALFTKPLHRYYQKTDVDLVCWFSEGEKRSLGIPDRADILEEQRIPADAWRVKERDITVGDDNASTGPLLLAMDILADDTVAKKTNPIGPQHSKPVLTSLKELRLNTVWRLLQDRGYISQDHTLSAWGKAFKAALDHARNQGYLAATNNETEAEEAIFIAFELLRLDVLNARSMFPSPPYTGAPLRGSETDKAHTLLISRIACLGTFQHKAIGYTGPLSRHLLAYHQMTAAVRSCLRDLAEIHACYMLLSGAVSRDISNEELTDLGTSLPFVREPDLGLALVVKSYLDELSNDPSRRSDIAKWFNHALDIHQDLDKAWMMWDAINTGIQEADGSIVNNETRKLFKNADEWLHHKRQATPNGTA